MNQLIIQWHGINPQVIYGYIMLYLYGGEENIFSNFKCFRYLIEDSFNLIAKALNDI